MLLLPGVLLRHLQLDRQPGLRHRGDHRGDRLARLEVHRPVLDLQDDVVVEPAVQRREVVVRRPRAVGGPVAPVLVVVVDERAPEHRAAERRQRPASRFAPSAWLRPYANGPGLPLGVRLHDEPAEVGDRRRRRAPPRRAHQSLHRRVERVGRRQAAEHDRRGEAHRQVHADAVRPERRRPVAATSSRWSVSSRASAACTLTLFSPTALIPTDAEQPRVLRDAASGRRGPARRTRRSSRRRTRAPPGP